MEGECRPSGNMVRTQRMHRQAQWQGLGVKHRVGTQFHKCQGVVFAIASRRIHARRTLTCVFSAARLCPNHPLKHGFRGHN